MAFDLSTAKPAGGFDLSTAKPVKQGTGSTVIDAGNAVGTGFFNGMARLAGLPADTAANVLDLGKAALGAPYIAATGKEPPEWLQVGDRSKVFGSGDNIIKNAKTTGFGNTMLTPANPEYDGGYLQAGGASMMGVINPVSGRQAVNQGINSLLGTLLGKGTYDATGNNALAIALGMTPTAIQSGAIDTTKYLVRGGEKGRRDMEQRIQDLKDAGINAPTVGLASGNRVIGGAENLLQNTPGAVGIMQRNRDAALTGVEAKTMGAADLASGNRGATASGQSIQSGARAFRDGVKTNQTRLYNNLGQQIPDQAPVEVGNTRGVLAALNEDIATMPELSKQFKNGRIQAIEGALDSDMAGTPANTSFTMQRVLAGTDASGMPFYKDVMVPQVTPAGAPRTAIPFEAVKKTRTMVGNEIADNSMMSDVPRSKWNPLYGALSDDMQGAATAAGPAAERTLNRANNYTRSSIARLERIAPVVDRTAPEQSFTALNNTLKENTTTFQAVKKSLPEGARGDFAGTVIERLGKAKPGQQNELGDKWSPESFLTNWNNMKPQARAELLSGFKNSAQVAADIEAVAKATAMMRDNSKMWANPSGTGANTFARGTLGAIGLGGAGAALGMVSPMVPIGAAGALAGSNLLARALTSQKNVNSLATNSYIDPQMLNAQVNALIGSGLLYNGQKQ